MVTQLKEIWKKRFQVWRSYGSLANQQAALCLLKEYCWFYLFFSKLYLMPAGNSSAFFGFQVCVFFTSRGLITELAAVGLFSPRAHMWITPGDKKKKTNLHC